LAEEAESERLILAIDRYSRGLVSQGKAAEIAGVSRAEFIEELFRRKIPAVQVTIEELREELKRE